MCCVVGARAPRVVPATTLRVLECVWQRVKLGERVCDSLAARCVVCETVWPVCVRARAPPFVYPQTHERRFSSRESEVAEEKVAGLRVI